MISHTKIKSINDYVTHARWTNKKNPFCSPTIINMININVRPKYPTVTLISQHLTRNSVQSRSNMTDNRHTLRLANTVAIPAYRMDRALDFFYRKSTEFTHQEHLSVRQY